MKTFIAALSLIFGLAAFTSMISLNGQADRMQQVRVSAQTEPVGN
jgi:hypothetical protein